MSKDGGSNRAASTHGKGTDGDEDDDPYSVMILDQPRFIRCKFPSRPPLSSPSSSGSHSRSSCSRSSSSQDSQSSSSRSSSTSLSDFSSTSDSDSETSLSSIRSQPKLSHQHFDAKSWFEKDMMQMKPNLTEFCNARPPILDYPWNAKECRNQFQTLKTRDPSDDKRRRLLNVTVMATTDRAIVKGRYPVNNLIVRLNFPSPMTTIRYEHRLKSHRVSDIRAPFQSTTVNVVNKDCLVVCEKLMNKAYYLMLLNIANQSRPGGGFRTGASAQEEDLFRRTNYSRSLDIKLYETAEKTNEHLCYVSSGEYKSYPANQSMYPLRPFGAIYTSGLCVFRHGADDGYSFMDEPLYDVCAIAIAAVQDPPVDNGQLSSDIADIMRKKVETIFAIAQDHKHDALVLSAFGCGAFHNPPEHVANIFKSVIEQYAGVFRRIDFAITGSPSDSKGNYSIFKKVLDGLILQRPNEAGSGRNNHEMQEDQKLSPHTRQRTPCRYGVECYVQYSEKNSIYHNAKYTHPCRYSELCTNQDKEPHYTHEPHKGHLCRYANNCKDLVDPVHRAKYRHAKLPDFLVPCKFQEKCYDKTWGHQVKYSHGELTREDNRSSQHSSGSRHHENDSGHHRSSMSSHLSKSRSRRGTNEERDHYC